MPRLLPLAEYRFLRKPRVFISSTIKGLAGHRAALHDLIVEHLQWHPWCDEIDGHAAGTNSLEVCRQHLKDADVVVCLIGDNYGTELGHEPRSFTQWEIDLATAYRKNILLYVQKTSAGAGRSAELNALLAVLRDELVGLFYVEFESAEQLCQKARSDLIAWWASPRTTARLAINQVIADPQTKATLAALMRGSPAMTPARTGRNYDHDYFESQCSLLMRQRIEDRYHDALLTGTRLFAYMARHNPPRSSDRGNLRSWADLLSVYYNVLGVTGLLRSGPISAVSLGKALFQVRRILGDTAGAVYAAQAVSGVMNSSGLHETALLWNDFALQRSAFLPEPWSIWDSRGSILRNLGRNSEAVEYLRRTAAVSKGPDTVLAYVLARLGGAYRESADRTRALNMLELAEKLAGDRLSRVSVLREWIAFFVAVDEPAEAVKRVREGISICHQFGFERPRRQIIQSALASRLVLS